MATKIYVPPASPKINAIFRLINSVIDLDFLTHPDSTCIIRFTSGDDVDITGNVINHTKIDDKTMDRMNEFSCDFAFPINFDLNGANFEFTFFAPTDFFIENGDVHDDIEELADFYTSGMGTIFFHDHNGHGSEIHVDETHVNITYRIHQSSGISNELKLTFPKNDELIYKIKSAIHLFFLYIKNDFYTLNV